MKVEVKNNMAFIKENDNIISYATFPNKEDNVVDINRVYTSTEKRGQGLAKIVMDGLYEHLKENNIKAIPTCPYAIAYFKRYTLKRDVLK